jgi:hypothetical protein
MVQGGTLVAIKILAKPSFDRGVIAERSNQLNYDSERNKFRTLNGPGWNPGRNQNLGEAKF